MPSTKRQETEFEARYFDELADIALKAHYIEPDLYKEYNVMRGLRKADGTGVLVGLTNIGDVHGYIMDEGEKVPVEGRLRYRGIDVEDIVDGFQKDRRFGYNETAYLLLFGKLPSSDQITLFRGMLDACRELPDGFMENMILKAPTPDVMNSLARSVLASYTYDKNPDSLEIRNVLRQCIELIARFPTFVAYGYQAKCHYYDNKSLVIHKPQTGMGTAQNFLHMIRPDSAFTELEAETLDLALVLHAEHGGGNNSAFALHVVTSSDTDTYSAIASAVGSLRGAKHGGANIKVAGMIEDIKQGIKDWADDDEVTAYLTKIIRKEAFDRTGLIYGMGHAIYTQSDPRSEILRAKAEELAKDKGCINEFNLLRSVERLTPTVFARAKGSNKAVCANVDLYSGLVYRMLNIPQELYTPIFAISRIAGWAAHRIEEIISGGRIIRPAYKSVVSRMAYIPVEQRNE
ncbi:MAG: citrate/2-methylcitrate synthase [Chitinispirillia bacterium]|nr:citrate/2-methylcitrate synthase [Chitinispirillia bacterium]MCL2269594.1 citrate/2-methylcitrate synthase [Chitinispirillia bacterium]